MNGVVISYDMHFPITDSFEHYEYSKILVPLNAGKNTIEVFNVSDHGVGRLDTMIVAPSEYAFCSNAPTVPGDVIPAINSGVELTWVSSAWPQDCTIRYYDVYRSTGAGFYPIGEEPHRYSVGNHLIHGRYSLVWHDLLLFGPGR